MLGHGESMSNLILDLHRETKEECALNMRVWWKRKSKEDMTFSTDDKIESLNSMLVSLLKRLNL